MPRCNGLGRLHHLRCRNAGVFLHVFGGVGVASLYMVGEGGSAVHRPLRARQLEPALQCQRRALRRRHLFRKRHDLRYWNCALERG